jgi:hypothetical protein
MPPGVGASWLVVVVNHDTDDVLPSQSSASASSLSSVSYGSMSLVRWQTCVPNLVFSVGYLAPVVTGVQVMGGISGGTSASRPAVGGFLLRVVGHDFGANPPVVTLAGTPCPILPVTNSTSLASVHEEVVCVAPPRAMGVPSVVVVDQAGQTSTPFPFAFDGASVISVTPPVFPAVGRESSSELSLLVLRGINFGVPNASAGVGYHVVTVGSAPCTGVQWWSDSELWCSVQGDFVVGSYIVSVVVGDVPGVLSTAVSAQCPSGFYGQHNETCTPCPAHAECKGGLSDPLAQVRCL